MRPLRLALRALRACRTLVDHARHLRPLSDTTRTRLEMVVADLRQAEANLKRAVVLEEQRAPSQQQEQHSNG